AAIRELRRTRHELVVRLGALGEAAPALSAETARSGMTGGKFAHLHRLHEHAEPLAADWVLLIDDDVRLPRRFLDRLLTVAELLRLHPAPPALTRGNPRPRGATP